MKRFLSLIGRRLATGALILLLALRRFALGVVISLLFGASALAQTQLPDLEGWNGQSSGYPNDYFACQQTTATWGQVIGVKMSVINNGPVASGAFSAYVCISKTRSFALNASGCYCVGTVSFPAIPAGEVAAVSTYVNLPLPASNPFGDSSTTFYVGMIVNANEAVAESNYTNNANQGIGIDSAAGTLTITAPAPQISVVGSTPPGNNLTFGNIALGGVGGAGGATGTQTLSITNNGAAPLTINNISLSGSSAFSITSLGSTLQVLPQPNTYPGTIQADGAETWVVNVAYNPTATGNQNANLVISSNDPTNPTITLSLSGTGVAGPQLVFTDPVPTNNNNLQANFGSVINDGAGGTSLTETFTLTNNGSGPLTVSKSGITLSSTQGGVWTLVSLTSNTQSGLNLTSLSSATQTIAANGTETWQLAVKFDPIANTSYQTTLQVASNDPTNPSLACALSGTGVIPMTISVASAVNGVTDTNPLVMNFGSLHATGQQTEAGTVTLTNTGQLPLVIALRGITLGSTTNFQIASITSSTQGTINLSTGTATIAPNGTETWTINITFDPTVAGTDNTTLTIQSNDPTHGTEPIALNGTGLNQPGILVTTPHGGTNLPFGNVLNDGAGNHVGTQTFTIQNIGLQTLTVSLRGITTSGAPFTVQSITSSTQGTINLATGSATIAAKQAEIWTITAGFDPTNSTPYTGSLSIASNDPVTPTASLALTGTGTVPTITTQPTTAGLPTLYVQAGQIYNIAWTSSDTSDTASSATLTLSTSASNSLPASGLTTLVSMPYNQSNQSYAWRPSSSLVGQEFYIYGAIQDGIVNAGSFSSQKVHIEAAGSFNLLSGLYTTNSNYTYQYIYNGTVYTGTTTLQPGQNSVTITTPLTGGGTVSHQITVTQTSSLVPSQGYTYDELNRIKTYTNGNGITTNYTYDKAGNLAQLSASNGDVTSYTYDNTNRKVTMVDSTGTTFYDYDDLDRLTAVTYSTDNVKADGLALTYAYDNANRLTDVYYPGGEHIQYTWDDAARLTGANDVTTGQSTTYTYNYTSGLLQSVSRANGITTKYAYNSAGLIDDIQHWSGSTLVAEYNYTINASGNATALLTTFPGGSQKQEQYTYDGLSRLCQVIYGSTATASPNDRTVIYAYDNNGNRLSATTKVNGATTQALSYTYGLDNQLTKITDQNSNVLASFVYDSAGNRVQMITPNGDTYYSYDERNLLTAMLSPTDYITYTYNGAGQRVSTVYDGTSTQYIIDPRNAAFQAVQERSGGVITRNHIYGLDRLESNVLPGNTASYYLPDRIGSVRLILNQSAAVVNSQNYDVFGQLQ